MSFTVKYPKKFGVYNGGIIMDDDTTTPFHLSEEPGPKTLQNILRIFSLMHTLSTIADPGETSITNYLSGV